MGETDLDVDVVDDVDDEWQRRQYLKQIYSSHERAREVLMRNRWKSNTEPATVALVDLIQLIEPMARREGIWQNEPIATFEVEAEPPDHPGRTTHIDQRPEKKEIEITGLGDVIAFQNGIPVEVDGHTTRAEIPLEALQKAFRAVTEFLYQKNILMAESGERDVEGGPV